MAKQGWTRLDNVIKDWARLFKAGRDWEVFVGWLVEKDIFI
jgi:hypothetical protein